MQRQGYRLKNPGVAFVQKLQNDLSACFQAMGGRELSQK